MDTVKKVSVILILFGVGIIIAGWTVAENVSEQMNEKKKFTPEQVVVSFYGKWRSENEPLAEGFHTFKTDISENFKIFLSEFSGDFDPVACTDMFPSSYSLSTAMIEGDRASVGFMSASAKAVINLKNIDHRWLIDSIICGE